MKTHTVIRGGAAGVLVLASLVGMSSAQAAGKTAIDRGGEYCFQYGSTALGGTRIVLSLDIDAADHMTKQKLWWASGIEKATNSDVATQNYVNNLSGTATVAKPNNGRPGAKLLQLGLTGTSFGSNTDPAVTGLWQLSYTLQLNPKTLKGKIVGVSVFTPISATTAGTPATIAVNEAVTPISCKKA